jgi:hypothetical protein
MLAVIGGVAGVAVGALQGKTQHSTASAATPDVEAGFVAHLAGPIAALAVEGEEAAEKPAEKAAEEKAEEPAEKAAEEPAEEPAEASMEVAPAAAEPAGKKLYNVTYRGVVPEGALTAFPTTPEQEELVTLAAKLNPIVGFYDPLNLSEGEFWDQSNEATIGFLRHAEIKHGRVAMAGFVGYCVHANGIHFPWKVPGDEFCAPGVSPPELWNNIPFEAKLQIILALGIFEFYSESAQSQCPEMGGHYMRGGKPGFFPPFTGLDGKSMPRNKDGLQLLPHPVPLNLYDPFKFNINKSEEWKAEKLQTEINNGRLAMIGLMSLLSEGAIPGSVPLLKGVIPSSGAVNVMDPFNFARDLVFMG